MKWVVGIIAVMLAFVAGFALGWTLRRPMVRVETAATPSPSPIPSPSPSLSPSPTPPPPPSPSLSRWTEDAAPFTWPATRAPAHQVLKVDDTHYVVDGGFIDDLLANQSKLASARMVPVYEDGGVVGVRLFGIRADSALAKLGIQNGDRLVSLNGVPLSDPAATLEAYTKTRAAKNLALEVVRREAPLTIHYRVQR